MKAMIARLSLHARLLLIAFITGIAALAFASLAIGSVLEDFVRRGVDEKLDTQIEVLQRAIRPDGQLERGQVIELPDFVDSGSQWGWRVQTARGTWSGGTTIASIQVRLRGPLTASRIRSGRGRSVDAQPLYLRQITISEAKGAATITAAAPRAMVDRPLFAALVPLTVALAFLALGLAAATWIQLRFGLQPLRRLRDQVELVRTGGARRLLLEQPRELLPLAMEVNALIEQNAEGLERARRHLSNLAHGLKTPLATLSLRLEREQATPDSKALVDLLDARIAHHLKRARSAAGATGRQTLTTIKEIVDDLVSAMRHLQPSKEVESQVVMDPTLVAAIDPQDLAELLGNLIDNAWRHAAGIVQIAASREGMMVRIDTEDDGVGIGKDKLADAIRAGVRLDESDVGYGFGLAIAQEIAELNGGALLLGHSELLGGLRAQVLLPGSVSSPKFVVPSQ